MSGDMEGVYRVFRGPHNKSNKDTGVYIETTMSNVLKAIKVNKAIQADPFSTCLCDSRPRRVSSVGSVRAFGGIMKAPMAS